MKLLPALGLLSLSALSTAAAGVKRDLVNNDYYVIHLERGVEPRDVAQRLGLEHEGEHALDDHHVFRSPRSDDDHVSTAIKERKRRKRDVGGVDLLDSVLLSQKQKPRRHLEKRIIPPPPEDLPVRSWQKPDEAAMKRRKQVMADLGITDPIFEDQWHLFNTVQTGHDVNVTGVWQNGVTGQNVTVALVDDGLDMNSNDLKANYFAEGSWDYNDHDPDPKPELFDDKHGTRCAGEVAAVKNDVCGLGVAYDAKIAGIRILSGDLTNADEAEAMIYKYQMNDIYSCSWGPPDDGRHMEAPDILIRRAMLQGIQEGRGGLGSIYVFASGNGASFGDNCNFDGYTNSIYSITVGAVDRAGLHPYYSEHCSANMVVTYSSGSGDSIHTTDVGEDQCYSGHGGTSAAAPLGAGIFALALSVRPELSWRDLQYLVLNTALPVADENANWQTTAIGKQFSHAFGYGKIDSYGLVEMAKEWELVKPQSWFFSPWQHVRKPLPEGEQGLSVNFEVTQDMLKNANLERVEHVTVTMNVEHTQRGDLSVDLISPENVVSHLAVEREKDVEKVGFDNWTFMSVAHWGESGVGKWTLVVKDTKVNKEKGNFIDWHLKLWGEAIDADKAEKLPMPKEDDDADHDEVVKSTQSAPATTATGPARPDDSHGHDAPDPTDQPKRPTKPAKPVTKPTSSESEDEVEDEDQTGTSDAQEASQSSESDSSSDENHWISWLPTLGASKTAQIWIYGAAGAIVVFCVGLGATLLVIRKRRQRNDPHNNYEFEMLDEEESEGLNSGEKGAPGSRRTRGGELYDAFAGGSDDDDFDRYSDRDPSMDARREEEQYVVGGESSDDDDDDDEKRGQSRPLR